MSSKFKLLQKQNARYDEAVQELHQQEEAKKEQGKAVAEAAPPPPVLQTRERRTYKKRQPKPPPPPPPKKTGKPRDKTRLVFVEKLNPNLVRLDVPTHNVSNYRAIALQFLKLHDLFVALVQNDNGDSDEWRRREAYSGLSRARRSMKVIDT